MRQASKEELRGGLHAFLRGEIDFADLEKRLEGYVEFFDRSDEEKHEVGANIPRPLNVSVILWPGDLRPMLERFLAWDTDAETLGRWASVIMMLDPYDNPPGLTEKECDDLMDPVWDLLWRLSFRPPEDQVRELVQTGLADLGELEVRLASRLSNATISE